ncbi:hypothetical protein RRG08_063496 [Elysia crispata]|uniref:Uncharacterized protein n=1 Tax=Elysia crispata TaxID=231223 RepID=A0AAE1B4D3_9GAST|nr:hypothetical protein RRG08_063496 [Elysia crispata]
MENYCYLITCRPVGRTRLPHSIRLLAKTDEKLIFLALHRIHDEGTDHKKSDCYIVPDALVTPCFGNLLDNHDTFGDAESPIRANVA